MRFLLSISPELILTYALFFGLPLAVLIYFAVSLFRFCRARRRNKHHPGSFEEGELKSRKLHLIVSSILFGVIFAVLIAFVVLFFLAIAFM